MAKKFGEGNRSSCSVTEVSRGFEGDNNIVVVVVVVVADRRQTSFGRTSCLPSIFVSIKTKGDELRATVEFNIR